jgi:hypothetical protein
MVPQVQDDTLSEVLHILINCKKQTEMEIITFEWAIARPWNGMVYRIGERQLQ